MDSSIKIQTLTSTTRPSKRLLLDRRYGLVFDEWRDPSEAALAGGRQMFCIVPLAKGLFKLASELANLTANSTIKVLQTPDLLSPPMLQATLNNHLHKFMSGIQKPQLKLFALKGFSPFHQTNGSSHLPTERSESQ